LRAHGGAVRARRPSAAARAVPGTSLPVSVAGPLAEVASAARAAFERPDAAATRFLIGCSTAALSRPMFAGMGQLVTAFVVTRLGSPSPLLDDLELGIPEVLDAAMDEMTLAHIIPGAPGGRPACEHAGAGR
jgi:hypothetical protein